MARLVCALAIVGLVAGGLRKSKQPLVADGPDMIVDVPVVEVVMASDGDMVDGADRGHFREPALSPTEKLHMECGKEMLFMAMNRTRLVKSQKCEQEAGHTNRSIAALQRGDTKAASEAVIQTFHDCASLSTKCAEAMAPGIVQKMRLSGVTVDHQCELVAKRLDGDAHARISNATETCEKNSTRSLIAQLQHDDLDGAMGVAQKGLEACNGLAAPCGFQLAPLLVTQVMAAHEAEEENLMFNAIFKGVNAAQQFAAKMRNTTKGQKLSLVTLATATRLASKSQVFKF
jgi:hypothetical protein